MDNKKIMILCYDMSIIGGVQTVTQTLATSLLGNDYNVVIVSLVTCKRLVNIPVNIDFVSLNLPQKRVRNNLIKGVFLIRRLIKQKQPDFVILQGSQMGTYLPFLGKLKTKIVYEDHGEIAYVKTSGIKGYVRMISCVFPQYADYIVTETTGAKEWLIENNKKIDQSKVYVINNAVDDSLEKLRAQYNHKSHRIFIITRLVPQKGIDRFLSMSDRILAGYDDWIVDIYGYGLMENEYINMIPATMKDRIRFKGPGLNKAEMYNNASFMILPSIWEGFPTVVLESLIFGTPVISYDISFGPADMIQDGVNGYLIEDDNVYEFIKKCHILMDNEELCISMSNNAVISSERFKEKNVVNEWRKLFDEQM